VLRVELTIVGRKRRLMKKLLHIERGIPYRRSMGGYSGTGGKKLASFPCAPWRFWGRESLARLQHPERGGLPQKKAIHENWEINRGTDLRGPINGQLFCPFVPLRGRHSVSEQGPGIRGCVTLLSRE